MKSKISHTEWETHVENWQGSGESQREYCRMHGINLWTFRGHLKKSGKKHAERFTEIRMKPRISEAIRIEVRGRYTIELPETASETTIEKLLRAIEALL
jgi:hypothetical protein